MSEQRRLLVVFAALLWLTVFSGRKDDATPEDLLCSGRWKLRYEGIDANHNSMFDKGEKTEVDTREKLYYEFEKGGSGKYSNSTVSGPSNIDMIWQMADSSRQLIVVMKGSTYRYHIQTLTAKTLIIEMKTVDGRGFEEYSHR